MLTYQPSALDFDTSGSNDQIHVRVDKLLRSQLALDCGGQSWLVFILDLFE